MKKVIISAALLLSMISFAQKDELKTLKKVYDKDAPTDFAKEVLEGYADALDEHICAIERGLAELLEHATYWL